MTGIIGILTWIVNNWQTIVMIGNAAFTVILFFMHGSAASDLQELQQFMNSLNVSTNQPTPPVNPTSATNVAQMKK